MECRNPEDSPTIINEVVNQWYFNVKKRSTEEFTATALDQAKKEQETIERDIAAKRDRLRGIAQRMPSGGLRDPANNITAQQVRQYGDQVAQLQLELSQLEQYRAIYNDPESIPITAEDRAIVEQDPQVAELARAMFLLEQQRAADAEVYGPEHKGSPPPRRSDPRPTKSSASGDWKNSASAARISAKPRTPPTSTPSTRSSSPRKTCSAPRPSSRTRTGCCSTTPRSPERSTATSATAINSSSTSAGCNG